MLVALVLKCLLVRLTVFGEWGCIAIVAAHGHSRFRTSFLEMKFWKSSEVVLYACCPCGEVFSVFCSLFSF